MILIRTRPREWTAPQRRMMLAATRRNVTATLAAAVLFGMMFGALTLRRNVDQQQKAIEAQGLISQLRAADIRAVPGVILPQGPSLVTTGAS